VTVAARISDINSKNMTDPGGRHHGKTIKIMSLKGAFHGRTDRPAQYSDSSIKNGRTDRPAQYSDSSIKNYRDNCATFRDRDNLITVEINDIDDLKRAFAEADVY